MQERNRVDSENLTKRKETGNKAYSKEMVLKKTAGNARAK